MKIPLICFHCVLLVVHYLMHSFCRLVGVLLEIRKNYPFFNGKLKSFRKMQF